MTEPVTKKRKADDANGIDRRNETVKDVWSDMKQRGPLLFPSLAAYLEDTNDSNDSVAELIAATYIKAAEMENRFSVPLEFQGFTIQRDSKDVITQIDDNENGKLTGKALTKVLTYGALAERGADKIIMQADADGSYEALVVWNGTQVEVANSKNKKAFHNQILKVYTFKSSTTVYAPSKIIQGVLGLDYVKLSDVLNLLKALNGVAAKEDLSELKPDELVDAQSLLDHLNDSDAKQSKKNFYQALLAAKVANLSTEDKIGVFSKNPTYKLANKLDFRLPHSGPLFTKLGNKPAQKVSLELVKAEDNILMATNFISQRDYSETNGDVGKLQVYVSTDDIGGRKGQKWAALPVRHEEKAKNVLALMKAISEANSNGKGSSGSGAVPGVVDDGRVDIELD